MKFYIKIKDNFLQFINKYPPNELLSLLELLIKKLIKNMNVSQKSIYNVFSILYNICQGGKKTMPGKFCGLTDPEWDIIVPPFSPLYR